ncbi:hypothetical protein OIO90_002707 [Microbotryomycetes sp. JL221]|nr:hypothetical protein OIO90_002707 [Microbotryomycetes sp. JL221]
MPSTHPGRTHSFPFLVTLLVFVFFVVSHAASSCSATTLIDFYDPESTTTIFDQIGWEDQEPTGVSWSQGEWQQDRRRALLVKGSPRVHKLGNIKHAGHANTSSWSSHRRSRREQRKLNRPVYA